MLYTHSKAYVCHYGQNNLADKAPIWYYSSDTIRLVNTRSNASLCNLYAISMQSRPSSNLVLMQSRSQCYLVFNAISFPMQSLDNLFQSPCNLYASSMQFPCNVIYDSLCNPYTIPTQSLCNLHAILIQSLRNLDAISMQFCAILRASFLKIYIRIEFYAKFGKWKDWSEIGWIDPRWGPSVGNFCRTGKGLVVYHWFGAFEND